MKATLSGVILGFLGLALVCDQEGVFRQSGWIIGFIWVCVVPTACTWIVVARQGVRRPKWIFYKGSRPAQLTLGFAIVALTVVISAAPLVWINRCVADPLVLAGSALIAARLCLLPLRRAIEPGRCRSCGFDIRASLDFGRCPECGAAFAVSESPSYCTSQSTS